VIFAAATAAAPAALEPRTLHAPPAERQRVVVARELPVEPAVASDDAVPEPVPNIFPGPGGIPGGETKRAARTRPGPRIEATAADATDATYPAIDVRFDGPYESWVYPPDPVMAAGPDHVVVLINRRIASYTDEGALADGPRSLRSFFGIPSSFSSFDPLAVFDPFARRFIVTCLADNGGAQDSRIYIAFSQTSDPTGAWNTYWIDADLGQEPNWADYTSIGIDRNAVYLTANMFSRSDSFQNVTLYIYDQADGYAGRPLDNTHLVDVRTAGGGSPYRLRPAFVGAVVPGDEYYLAQASTSFNDTLNLFRLAGDRFDAPTLTPSTLSLPDFYWGAGDARQPADAGVPTLGSSLWNVYYRNGEVWTAQAVDDGDLVAWVHRIDVASTPGAVETTYVVGEAGKDAYFPHVLPDGEDDDFALLTAFSSDSDYVTGRYWNVGADGVIRQTELLTDGLLTNTSGRHGDYFSVGEDPDDPNRVWMIAQYMKNSSSSGSQMIASVLFEEATPPVDPPPVPDGRDGGQQVEVAKAGGGDVTVTWDAITCPADGNHLVWFDLADIASYAIAAEECSIGTSGSWTGTPPAGNVGVIVVGDDPASRTEGSHGLDSTGAERPSTSMVCADAKSTAGTCAP
jgi:hypothetical protein